MILVCGEALIDLFIDLSGEGLGSDAMPARAVPGGSPMNVAIGLRRLGIDSSFLGGLSRDAMGARLAALLTREGVALDFAPRTPRRTTLAMVATDASGHPAYSFYGEGAADVSLSASDLPPALPDTVQAITFGSYTLVVDPVGAAYLALARRESGRRVISVDPNMRPTVTPDRDIWRARFHDFVDCATIIKSSDEDIALGYGEGAEMDRVAADWLRRGVRLVVVTRGAKGSRAYTKTHRVDAPGRAVSVIDTVGAGDTVHAAMLARLQARGRLSADGVGALDAGALGDLLDYVNAAAALTCSRKGADLPTASDVERAMTRGR